MGTSRPIIFLPAAAPAIIEASKLVLFARKQTKRSAKNCKLIKKAETKNHHQIILGNHEFSGKRLEEKSEKGKRYHRKGEREFQKLRGSISTTRWKWKGRGSGKTGKSKRGQGNHSFCRHNQPHASRKGMKIWSRVREIWANPYRVYGLGTTRIREEKPGNWKFARGYRVDQEANIP